MLSAEPHPITASFEPPVKPKYWCGSIRPMTILKSAFPKASLILTGVPRRVVPKSFICASRASWVTTLQLRTILDEKILSIISRFGGGWSPFPTIIVTAGGSKSGSAWNNGWMIFDKSASTGTGLVSSGMTMAILDGFFLLNWAMNRVLFRARSNMFENVSRTDIASGCRTVTLAFSGIFISFWPLWYFKRYSNAQSCFNLFLEITHGRCQLFKIRNNSKFKENNLLHQYKWNF